MVVTIKIQLAINGIRLMQRGPEDVDPVTATLTP